MSDYQQDPGATSVLPAAPPSPPPAPPLTPTGGGVPGRRGGVPWWAVILIALFVGLLAAGGAYLAARATGSPAPTEISDLKKVNEDLQFQLNDLKSRLVTLTAEASASKTGPPPAGTASPPEETAPTSSSRQFGYVTKMIWDDPDGPYHITVDYAQFLTGAQAAAAAAAHGDESPPPNDYYIVNDNKKMRTFTATADVPVTVYKWSGADWSPQTVSIGDWFYAMPGGTSPQDPWKSAPYWITLSGSKITKIEQQYLP
jgi:hypothetical protein